MYGVWFWGFFVCLFFKYLWKRLGNAFACHCVDLNMAAGLFVSFFNVFLLSVASALAIVIVVYLHMCTKQGLKLFFKHLTSILRSVTGNCWQWVESGGARIRRRVSKGGGRRKACLGVLLCSWLSQACDERF